MACSGYHSPQFSEDLAWLPAWLQPYEQPNNGFHAGSEEYAVPVVGKPVSDDDIEALISNEIFQPKVIWSLSDLQVTSGTLGLSTATVKLIDSEGVERIACSVGTGPVHAAYEAVNSIVQVPVTLIEYSLNSVTEGIDAVVITRVLIRSDKSGQYTHALTGEPFNRSFSGSAADMDVVVSSVRAYISALNKMLGFRERSRIKIQKPESLTV